MKALKSILMYWLRHLDRLLGIVSLIFSPILISLICVWILEAPPSQVFKINKVIITQSQATIVIPVPVDVELPSNKSMYFLEVKNANGLVIKTYPAKQLKQGFDVSGATIDLPKLEPGTYTIGAELVYYFNPFKNGTTDIQIAKLIIE